MENNFHFSKKYFHASKPVSDIPHCLLTAASQHSKAGAAGGP